MRQENPSGNIDKPATVMPRSRRSQAAIGPQGTRLFEAADLDKIRSRLVRPPPSPADHPSLLGINLPFSGQRFPLKAGINTFGRAPGNDVVLNDPGVSAIHAKIVQEAEGWRIVNLLSTNGTFVNGKKQTISPLKPGDRIRFGRAEFVFDYPDKLAFSPKTLPVHNSAYSERLIWSLVTASAVLLTTGAVLFFFW